MLNCDVYGKNATGGYGDDGLYCFTYDLHQSGDVTPEFEPIVDKSRTENGSYAMYAAGKNEKTMTLHFTGTQEQVRDAAEAAKYGELAVSGIYTGKPSTLSFDTAVYCYVDGNISTTLISPHIDLMSIDIPVIIRDEATKVPNAVIKYDGDYAVKFGNLVVPLAECAYKGGGVYEHPVTFEMVGSANKCIIMGVSDIVSTFTAIPTAQVINDNTGEVTQVNFVLTETEEEAVYIDIPGSNNTFTVILSVKPPRSAKTFKPFTIKFKVYRR